MICSEIFFGKYNIFFKENKFCFTCWISDNSPWSSKVLDKCETPEKDKNENQMSHCTMVQE